MRIWIVYHPYLDERRFLVNVNLYENRIVGPGMKTGRGALLSVTIICIQTENVFFLGATGA